jgi:AraC-like DNA-binding protein
LIKELTDTNTYLYNLLTDKNPYYIFESFSPSLICIIQQIRKNIDSAHALNKLFLYESILRLFNAFLSNVNERLIPDVKSRIHAADISRLFHVRKIVPDNLCDPPSMNTLSKEAGMSVSKLQKCFKLVFGKSIIRYAIEEKMKYAKDLLVSGEYSVSEVGYMVGYSNLSHFSEAFRKMFHTTPKTYLLSLQHLQDECPCCGLNRNK